MQRQLGQLRPHVVVVKNRVQQFDVPSFLLRERDDSRLYVLCREDRSVLAHPLDEPLVFSREHRKVLEKTCLTRIHRTPLLKKSHTASHSRAPTAQLLASRVALSSRVDDQELNSARTNEDSRLKNPWV